MEEREDGELDEDDDDDPEELLPLLFEDEEEPLLDDGELEDDLPPFYYFFLALSSCFAYTFANSSAYFCYKRRFGASLIKARRSSVIAPRPIEV